MLKEFCGYDESKYDLYQKEKREKIRKRILKVLLWSLCILFAVSFAYLVTHKCIAKTVVPNDSMEPTLSKNDRLIVNTVTYKLFEPERFDVAVIRRGDDEHIIYDIKRIYGLPGETIQITDGKIFINGNELEDRIKASETKLSGIAVEEIKLDKDEYFVLADDRDKEDSRFAGYGHVYKKDILGKASVRTNKFGFVNMFNKK